MNHIHISDTPFKVVFSKKFNTLYNLDLESNLAKIAATKQLMSVMATGQYIWLLNC